MSKAKKLIDKVTIKEGVVFTGLGGFEDSHEIQPFDLIGSVNDLRDAMDKIKDFTKETNAKLKKISKSPAFKAAVATSKKKSVTVGEFNKVNNDMHNLLLQLEFNTLMHILGF